jgi:hypothetical protein
MGSYEIDLFTHSLSVDAAFRAGILGGDEATWSSIALTPREREALETGDLAWLHAYGANDFLLHNLARFRLGGLSPGVYGSRINGPVIGS